MAARSTMLSSVLFRTPMLSRGFHAAPRSKPSLKTLAQPYKPRFNSVFPSLREAQSSNTAWWTRVGTTAGVVAAGVVGINYALNRQTRDALSPFEQSFLNRTFGYTGLGLALTAVAAVGSHRFGATRRLMTLNPWLQVGVCAAGSIGSMLMLFNTDSNNTVQKTLAFGAFQVFQGLTLSPLVFVNPVLLARAGLYTAGLMGGLCYVGATAKSDQFLYMGGPLVAGLCVVALASLAPLALPVTAVRTLALSESINLYGGLAIFGGFTLYDTQKVLAKARAARAGMMKADPLKEAVSFELNFINIFIRMLSILSGGSQRK